MKDEELSPDEYKKICENNEAKGRQLEDLNNEYKSKKKDLETELVYQCSCCKKYYKGEGITSHNRQKGNNFPRICINCVKPKVEGISIKIPDPKELDAFYDDERNEGEWYPFEFNIQTNTGTKEDRHDIIEIRDDMRNTLLRIDVRGESILISPELEMEEDTTTHGKFILKTSKLFIDKL